MAYTPCVPNVAQNIANSCTAPIQAGYTGRALLYRANDYVPTVDQADKRLITDIASVGLNAFKHAAIDNTGFAEVFAGSGKALSVETGMHMFAKTFSFVAPLRGSSASTKLFEAIVNSPDGFVVIAEKVDKVGNGSYEIIGHERPLMVTDDGYTKSEFANGGAAVITLDTVERGEEYVFFDTSLATTKTAFETLFLAATPA